LVRAAEVAVEPADRGTPTMCCVVTGRAWLPRNERSRQRRRKKSVARAALTAPTASSRPRPKCRFSTDEAATLAPFRDERGPSRPEDAHALSPTAREIQLG
jgi:hypothetical protein